MSQPTTSLTGRAPALAGAPGGIGAAVVRRLAAGPRVVVTDGRSAAAAERLTAAGGVVLRYGLVGILLWLGAFKWTPTEAAAIQPLLAHSPLAAWIYGVTDLAGASRLVGATEIATALLIALRPWRPALSAVGSLLAVGTFLVTLSFLATTPGAWARVDGFVVPGAVGSFLVKDVFLLGAALWTAGEALRAARGRTTR